MENTIKVRPIHVKNVIIYVILAKNSLIIVHPADWMVQKLQVASLKNARKVFILIYKVKILVKFAMISVIRVILILLTVPLVN